MPERVASFVLFCLMTITTGAAMTEDSTGPVLRATAEGGTYRVFPMTEGGTRVEVRFEIDPAAPAPDAVEVVTWLTDAQGRMIGGKSAIGKVALEKGVGRHAYSLDIGYYQIWTEVALGTERLRAWTDCAIVPPHHPGIRKDSFFGSNTSEVRTGQDGALLQMLGLKVQRAHFQPSVSRWPETSTGEALPLDFAKLDKQFAEARALDLWVLPIVAYALHGKGTIGKSELAERLHMHGPPRHREEFVNTWRTILAHYPEIRTWEFWNEPWIFGWTWAADAETYRAYQDDWCAMAHEVDPDLRILAGNSSMFAVDHIEPYPASWRGAIQGLTHHPYGYSTDKPTFRHGDQFRSMDYGMQVTRRMGLPYYYLTEGGTWYKAPPPEVFAREAEALASLDESIRNQKQAIRKLKDAEATDDEIATARARMKTLKTEQQTLAATLPNPENNLANACKIVQYTVRQALCGGFQTNMQWNIGYGPGWTLPNAAVATCTHHLTDRPAVADIWPEQCLITGAIFANSRFVNDTVRALPRADELSARWDVPVPDTRTEDTTKVAVLFAQTGPSPDMPDTDGQIHLDNTDGALRALDLTGRPIDPDGDALLLPFGEAPVYVLTDSLDVAGLRERIRTGRIETVTPINVDALSLDAPPGIAKTLRVRIENQMNVPVGSELVASLQKRSTDPVSVHLNPAELKEIELPLPDIAVSESGLYEVLLHGLFSPLGPDEKPLWDQPYTHESRHVVQVARFEKRTVAVDGDLKDWEGSAPIILDSDMLASGVDLTDYLLNPHLEKPLENANSTRVVARVYTAYDEDNVYLAAIIDEPSFSCTAGQPIVKRETELPYRKGIPGRLDHPVYCGDVLQVAFGFRDRVPGHGRQMDDPWRWKGWFCDTDYLYNLHDSTEGPVVMRQWSADGPRRNGYQTESAPGIEPVAGSRLVIRRDEESKRTIYEAMIPRTELALFDPSARRCRFGVIVHTDEKMASLRWSEACGIFDYWRGQGSWAPTWSHELPCQTVFGIE